jgi:hypothetical protein
MRDLRQELLADTLLRGTQLGDKFLQVGQLSRIHRQFVFHRHAGLAFSLSLQPSAS